MTCHVCKYTSRDIGEGLKRENRARTMHTHAQTLTHTQTHTHVNKRSVLFGCLGHVRLHLSNRNRTQKVKPNTRPDVINLFLGLTVCLFLSIVVSFPLATAWLALHACTAKVN